MNNVVLSRDTLQKLYGRGRSMAEIAISLNCSIHKVVYWMDKYGLERRSLSQALYFKLNPDGDPFEIKTNLTKEEVFLFGLGMGIYWGEGEKTSTGKIRVANTDPKLLRTFENFLMKICGVKKIKIFYSVICFNDSNPEEAKSYWAQELNISEEKFGKIVQIPPQGKGIYKNKSKFGVCTISVYNTKLKSWTMQQLEEIKHVPG